MLCAERKLTIAQFALAFAFNYVFVSDLVAISSPGMRKDRIWRRVSACMIDKVELAAVINM